MNLTALKIYQEKNKTHLILFCLIASIVEFFYSYIAIILESKISEYFYLDFFSIFIFLLLAILNFFAKEKTIQVNYQTSILSAFFLSIFNPQVIPFWVLISHEIKKWKIIFEPIFLFYLGISFGTFLSIFLFAVLFQKLIKKISEKKLNQILGLVFFGLFLISLLKQILKLI